MVRRDLDFSFWLMLLHWREREQHWPLLGLSRDFSYPRLRQETPELQVLLAVLKVGFTFKIFTCKSSETGVLSAVVGLDRTDPFQICSGP